LPLRVQLCSRTLEGLVERQKLLRCFSPAFTLRGASVKIMKLGAGAIVHDVLGHHAAVLDLLVLCSQ